MVLPPPNLLRSRMGEEGEGVDERVGIWSSGAVSGVRRPFSGGRKKERGKAYDGDGSIFLVVGVGCGKGIAESGMGWAEVCGAFGEEGVGELWGRGGGPSG